MKLIVNADDFGFCRGVNYGIVDAYRYGIVRSATIMANGNAFEHAVELAKQNQGLRIGVHLTLTSGQAVGRGYKSIADDFGHFYSLQHLTDEEEMLDTKEIELEFIAQIEKVKRAGINPSHLDSHHHTHLLDMVLPVLIKIARKYHLPIRVQNALQLQDGNEDILSPNRLEDGFTGEGASVKRLTQIIDQLEEGKTAELICHPAYADQYLIEHSANNMSRTKELEVLTSPQILSYIANKRIELLNFALL